MYTSRVFQVPWESFTSLLQLHLMTGSSLDTYSWGNFSMGFHNLPPLRKFVPEFHILTVSHSLLRVDLQFHLPWPHQGLHILHLLLAAFTYATISNIILTSHLVRVLGSWLAHGQSPSRFCFWGYALAFPPKGLAMGEVSTPFIRRASFSSPIDVRLHTYPHNSNHQ